MDSELYQAFIEGPTMASLSFLTWQSVKSVVTEPLTATEASKWETPHEPYDSEVVTKWPRRFAKFPFTSAWRNKTLPKSASENKPMQYVLHGTKRSRCRSAESKNRIAIAGAGSNPAALTTIPAPVVRDARWYKRVGCECTPPEPVSERQRKLTTKTSMKQADYEVTIRTKFEEIERITKSIQWLQANWELLQSTGLADKMTTYLTGYDFEELTRGEVLRLLKTFPGNWDKDTIGEGMNYTLRDHEPRLRAYHVQLPPCCVVVEEHVEIPPQPARIEKRRKIVCSPTDDTSQNLN